MVDDFSWQTTVPGFPVTAKFSDMVIFDSKNNPYRDTRVTLSGNFTTNPGRWTYGLSLSAGYVRIADDDGGKSAYEWGETNSAFFYSTGLLFSNFRRRQYEMFGNGLSLNLRGISIVENFRPRVEGFLRAGAETRFPLYLALYGAYDETGMTLHGVSRNYGQPIYNGVVSREYSVLSKHYTSWLLGGEMSAGIFSFEIQKNLSHIYFNRFFGNLTLRSVLYDSKGHADAEGIDINGTHLAQSLVLKLGLQFSVIPVKSVPFFLEPNIWGAWKFSNTFTGNGFPWGYGFGFNLRY